MKKQALPLSVLEEALQAVSVDRHADYGDVRENFTRWRDMCQSTGRAGLATISGEDLAIVMILLKVSRETNAAKRDNAVDIAGYASLLHDVRGL